ncbi:MAG: GNAT family N-acetyltransferase [Thermoproteota archaeon]|jgi:SSU ribosomal protein S18P alanine acetyltransferase (EC 2.3.1.-)
MEVTEFKVREIKEDEVKDVIEINRKSLPENYSPDYFYYHLREHGDLFLVASIEKDGKNIIAGYSMGRIEFGLSNFSFSFTKKGHIISIAVLEEYRRKGIGLALMKESLDRMKKLGAKEAYLEVRVTNHPAINLYKKLNFVIVNRIVSYYSDGEDAYVMAVNFRTTTAKS